MKYAQESLFKYLTRTKGLSGVLCERKVIEGTGVFDYISNKFAPISLYDADIFCGFARDVTLFKKKYLLTTDGALIAEGMTHSDYFINWIGFDESGLGEGSQLVSRNATIDITWNNHPIYIEEPVIFIGGDTIVEPNWAHWFFEHLLKLRVLQLSGINLELKIVVSERIPKRFLDWGELLIGRKLNWMSIDLDQNLYFKQMYVSSCPAYRDKLRNPHIWHEGFYYLRDKFLASKNKLPPTKCHFFSRSATKFRKAVNEDELYSIAHLQLGAIKTSLAGLSIQDQVSQSRQTKIAIFFGGADGPMSIFLPTGAKVLEVTAPKHGAFYTCLAFMALIRGQYVRLVADSSVGDYQGAHPLNRDYHVNASKFSRILSQMVSQ